MCSCAFRLGRVEFWPCAHSHLRTASRSIFVYTSAYCSMASKQQVSVVQSQSQVIISAERSLARLFPSRPREFDFGPRILCWSTETASVARLNLLRRRGQQRCEAQASFSDLWYLVALFAMCDVSFCTASLTIQNDSRSRSRCFELALGRLPPSQRFGQSIPADFSRGFPMLV